MCLLWKRNFYLIVTGLAVLFNGCYPTTRITGSWKSPSAESAYHTVFVAALSGSALSRSTVEKDMATALSEAGVTALMSIDHFPPAFSEDTISRGKLLEKVRESGAEAILTISLLKKETDSRYVSGGYAPLSQWSYYGSFWGYYGHWSPYAFSPGYYQQEEYYYLESNLYDSATQLLLWSAQSRTQGYDGLAGLSGEFSSKVVAKMISDGVIR